MSLRNYANSRNVKTLYGRLLPLAVILNALMGCSSWQQQLIPGKPFQHVIAYRTPPGDNGLLHIYIHGDGTPFATPTKVAADPSPRRPYVLSLMAKDPASSMLLGRPCYFRARTADRCHPQWWTTHRYAQIVVDSMVAAANSLANGREVVLVGYSGGGTLAMLMAPEVAHLAGVITIAANLDVDQWASLHGYTPLDGSLNPAHQAAQTAAVPQVHFFGARDNAVPPTLAEGLIARFSPGSVRVIPKQDHDCCWHQQWPELLDQALQAF